LDRPCREPTPDNPPSVRPPRNPRPQPYSAAPQNPPHESAHTGPPARRPPSEPALREQINRLFARDQAPRLGGRLDEALEKTNRELREPLEQIFDRYGVPTYAAVGPEASSQFAIMIQHQPPDFRRKVLPKLKANVDAGQGDAGVYAMMYDRAATDEGRSQRYGENFTCDPEHPEMHPYPIEDEAHVDDRRAALGKVRLALQKQIIAKFYGSSPCSRR